MAKDNVNHPGHYNIPGRKECIEEMLEKYGREAVLSFCLLNRYKYYYRADRKNGKEDICKAVWYERRYLEMGGDLEKLKL